MGTFIQDRISKTMCGSRKFRQRESNSDMFFFLFFVVVFFLFFVFCVSDDERGDQNNTKSGPISTHKRNAITVAFRWRAYDGPTLNAGLVLQGIRTSIAKKPYIFVIFQCVGRGPDPCPPPPHLDPPMKTSQHTLAKTCQSWTPSEFRSKEKRV